MQMHRFDRGRGHLGHTHYTAPNPPDGAIITYYVSPKLLEGKSERTIRVDILDGDGRFISRLEAPQGAAGAGLQRLVWDLRHPLAFDPSPNDAPRLFRRTPPGPFVLPGEYQARLEVGSAEQIQRFAVRGDIAIDLTAEDRRVWHDTLQALNQMLAVTTGILRTTVRAEEQLDEMRTILEVSTEAPTSLSVELEGTRARVAQIRREMLGQSTGGGAQQPGAPPLARRLSTLYTRIEGSTGIPTDEQRFLTERSHQELSRVVTTVNQLLLDDLPTLKKELEEAGVPWTMGRTLALAPLEVPPPPPSR
jgi:hypothetical protein